MMKLQLTESELISLVKKNVSQMRLEDKWNALNEEEKDAVVQYSQILTGRKDIIKELLIKWVLVAGLSMIKLIFSAR